MKTQIQLRRIQAQIYRLNNQYMNMQRLNRKQDTRRKIQLGGLIKKAGLENESTAVLYGLLLEAKDNLKIKKDEWRLKGDIAFTRDQKNDEFYDH
jgi:hypothetical protein